ncbi:uncharacterized protein C8R40DRAFT_1108661 [Lentinula edodes]|uniref:uncharacterized protein n=1 Tax=Lentinula edodes TaxID=5353 RepID=UPI001E8D59B5|nr:uncharacterized protein C8R40DRAFT_1108661 [Lentinula edodes]KAH7874382.1 hypothetical protein C8R40DRAFT_1108661 [Lentinula edodes]
MDQSLCGAFAFASCLLQVTLILSGVAGSVFGALRKNAPPENGTIYIGRQVDVCKMTGHMSD